MLDLEKKVKLCELFDYYGKLLTQKQQEIFELYYLQDLSLYEIAEELKISRQGARDAIVKAENLLVDFEKKCGFAQKSNFAKQQLLKLEQTLNANDGLQVEIIKNIHDIINKL